MMAPRPLGLAGRLLFQIMIFNSVQPPRWQTSDIYYDATLHHDSNLSFIHFFLRLLVCDHTCILYPFGVRWRILLVPILSRSR